MGESALLRQWALLEDELMPALAAIHPSRTPATWSLGPAADAVGLIVACRQATRGKTDLLAFASDPLPRAAPVSFGPADLRYVPGQSRDASFTRHGGRWIPARVVADRVVLAEPTQAVDLLTVRARRSSAVDTVNRCSDRLRSGGHLLVLDPDPNDRERLAGFVSIRRGDRRYHLYRKNGDAAGPDRRSGRDPAAGGDPLTLAARAAQDELVVNHLGLARSVARRFADRGEPVDDLEQVAFLALVKAARRFDPSLEFSFTTFATATIEGELKRHFRDRTWSMRVPRAVKDLYLAVKAARDELSHQLSATPSVRQIAEHLGASEDAVLEAMDAGDAYWPESLDVGYADGDPGTDIPIEDGGYERALQTHALRVLLPRLEERERVVVGRIFFDHQTQRAVGAELGLSQMQVSRILSGAVAKLRRWARDR